MDFLIIVKKKKHTFFVISGDPIGQPFITESSETLGMGTNETVIMATCTGPEGWPAPQLSWTLASVPVTLILIPRIILIHSVNTIGSIFFI